ncbi:hypothetical protein [Rhizobium sp. SGZ-381]|uniref:hypothetical protein n=1 Tax=Rhizobium sp. SGZ-381 TaxID=3342800 RepID=UPI00366B59C2
MSKVLRAIAIHAPIVLRDSVGIAGVGSVAYGCYIIMPAAGFIVGGALAIAGSYLASRAN